MLKKVALGIATSAALALAGGSVAFAANPSGTGQPNQSCQAQTASPGNAANTSAAAFNPTGTAATHYAGQQPQNQKNPKSVSQYDVACYQVSH